MADLSQIFEQATKDVTNLPQKPDNDTLLELYALYKQSTEGDNTGSRPGFLDMVGRAKYDAWAKLKGMPNEGAMQTYVDLVNGLKD